MVGQCEELSADQRRLVALAVGLPLVAAMTLQRPLRQVLAVGTVGEVPRVALGLQRR